jgi:hypothetical protein
LDFDEFFRYSGIYRRFAKDIQDRACHMPTSPDFYSSVRAELAAIAQAGLFKQERIIVTPQGSEIKTADGRSVINLCANNYLGLSSDPSVVSAARRVLDERGFGLSSVRFICGTQDKHKELERRLSAFLGTEDTILYGSAFDANGGLFETLFGADDAIISDELNHASIIDGIRLSKARRYRYRHDDLEDLRAQARDSRLSFLTAYSRWMAPLPGWTRYAQSVMSTALCWVWTIAMQQAFWGREGGARMNTVAFSARWTSLPVRWARRLAVLPGASPAPALMLWRCCASVRARICFPTP